jgi:hypothetical protein
MKKILLTFILFLISFLSLSYEYNNNPKDIIEVKKDTFEFHFVNTHDLFVDQWHKLPQPLFWKEVMKLSPDSCILNVARTRQILRKESLENWDKLTDEEKEYARIKLREVYQLDSAERIFMTTGKSNFYQFELVYPSIKRAIKIFKDNNTDPWYAQAILMIESPGKLEKSVSGAYGPFQLMKSVARNHGLRVDKYVDERKDFDKSAYGSAHLLRTSCIPEAKRIMHKFGVDVTPKMEYQLWFRLLVLHNYHAGAGNVENVLTYVVKPDCGCQSVITKIWQSSYGRFGNSSQNYSQLALASLLVLDDFIVKECKVK